MNNENFRVLLGSPISLLLACDRVFGVSPIIQVKALPTLISSIPILPIPCISICRPDQNWIKFGSYLFCMLLINDWDHLIKDQLIEDHPVETGCSLPIQWTTNLKAGSTLCCNGPQNISGKQVLHLIIAERKKMLHTILLLIGDVF